MKAGPKRGWRQGDLYLFKIQYVFFSDRGAVQYFGRCGNNHLLVQKMGQSEPAPTSAPMWMDGALMGVPFSSLHVPGLTKVGNSSWPFIFLSSAQVGFLWELFFSSPLTLAQVSLTYLHLDYLPMHPSLLPPHLLTYLPTYPPIYLPIHQFAYLPNNLPTYVFMH